MGDGMGFEAFSMPDAFLLSPLLPFAVQLHPRVLAILEYLICLFAAERRACCLITFSPTVSLPPPPVTTTILTL